MKKLTAILLVLVLLFTTSATTLAADGEGLSGGDSTFTSGSGSSDVYIKYSSDTSQISAKVPLSVTLAVRNDKKLVVPGGYGITSTCLIPAHVESVSIKTESPYMLVDTLSADNQIKLTLTAGSNAVQLTAPTANTATAQTITNGEWNIPAGGTLGLTFSGGEVFNVSNAWTSAPKVFTITYTIAAGVAG